MKPDPTRTFAPPRLTTAQGHPHPAIAAIKALSKGDARKDQQIIALNFVIDDLARTYDMSYRPDDAGGERDTAFAEGRRSVGNQLRRIIMQPIDELTGKSSRTKEGP